MVTHNRFTNSNNRTARRSNNSSQWHSNKRTNAPAQGRYADNSVRYQLCNRQGHTGNVCRSQSYNHLEAKANFLSDNQAAESQWIVDSDVTHHVTTETTNLEEYNGTKGIAMGDGKRISITHHGSTKLIASNNAFRLTDTLCTCYEILSVSKFCQDNLTSIKFFLALLQLDGHKKTMYHCPLIHRSRVPTCC